MTHGMFGGAFGDGNGGSTKNCSFDMESLTGEGGCMAHRPVVVELKWGPKFDIGVSV